MFRRCRCTGQGDRSGCVSFLLFLPQVRHDDESASFSFRTTKTMRASRERVPTKKSDGRWVFFCFVLVCVCVQVVLFVSREKKRTIVVDRERSSPTRRRRDGARNKYSVPRVWHSVTSLHTSSSSLSVRIVWAARDVERKRTIVSHVRTTDGGRARAMSSYQKKKSGALVDAERTLLSRTKEIGNEYVLDDRRWYEADRGNRLHKLAK